METNLELFGSNWIYAALALTILTFLLHIPLFLKYNLSKRSWKKVDYLWIGLTALGLIGSTRKFEMEVSEAKAAGLSYQIYVQKKFILEFTDPDRNSWICMKFNKTELSPANLDEIQKDHDKACEIKNKLFKLASELDSTKNTKLDSNLMNGFYPISNEILDFKDRVNTYINKYNEDIQRQEDLLKLSRQNGNDYMIYFMASLLLIIGLSIRLTKVTGELILEK